MRRTTNTARTGRSVRHARGHAHAWSAATVAALVVAAVTVAGLPAVAAADPGSDATSVAAPTVEEIPAVEEAVPAEKAQAVEAAPVVTAAAPAGPAAAKPATVTVHVGGYRTGTSTVSGLPGVTLGLFTTEGAATPVAGDWATATSDAQGVVTFTVPADQLASGTPFWVKGVSGAGGYALAAQLATAPITDPSNDTTRGYAFRTPVLVPGGTYESGKDFMTLPTRGTDYTASEGTWALSYTNPTLAQQCGVRVALVVDLSASVLQANATTALRGAAKTYVDALLGTPSQVQLFSFGTTATVESGLTPVSTQANVDALNRKINALTPASSAYTNWDDALWTVAQQPGAFDLAVVVTDGNPTVYAASQDGKSTRFAEAEAGIFSANALKLEGTRILALGVGDSVGSVGAGVNLAAISGPGAYVQSGSYGDAGTWLRDMVFAACTPSLTVVKQVADGDALAPAGGWTFDAATASDVVASLAASGITADGTGAVNFPVEFTSPSATDAAITITERQQAGYEIAPQDGRNAVCTVKNTLHPTGTTLPVTDEGGLGFTLTMSAGDMVTCTVVNTLLPVVVPEPPAPVYDLALRVWVSQVHRDGVLVYQLSSGADEPGPDYQIPYVEVQPGDLLTHDLRLFNQGDTTARVTQLVDYVPAGLELVRVDGVNEGWSLAANGNLYLDPDEPIVLLPGQELDVLLVLRVTEDADTEATLDNYAEISGFEGLVASPAAPLAARLGAAPLGGWATVDDVDSQADDDNSWVEPGLLGAKFENNEIDEHGTVDLPDTDDEDLDNDQDDHDGNFLRVLRLAPTDVPTVEPAVPAGDPTVTADEPTEVAHVVAQQRGRLASTGATVGAVVGLAAMLLAGGAVLLVVRRRLDGGHQG